MKIKHNKIRCLKCNDVIESLYGHDFKWCKCRSVAVDGGKEYLRRLGNREDYKEESEHVL
jgi:hypothetical protein